MELPKGPPASGSQSDEERPGWPKLLHFLAVNTAVGAALGALFALLLLWTNTAGLADLIQGTSDRVTPVILFVVGFSTLIGGLYAGSAVMLLPWDDDPGG